MQVHVIYVQSVKQNKKCIIMQVKKVQSFSVRMHSKSYGGWAPPVLIGETYSAP